MDDELDPNIIPNWTFHPESLSASSDPLAIFLFSRIEAIDAFEKFQAAPVRCPVCHDVVTEDYGPRYVERKKVIIAEVQSRAAGGCIGCILLLRGHEKAMQQYSARDRHPSEPSEPPQQDDIKLFAKIWVREFWTRLHVSSYYGDRYFELFTALNSKGPEMYIERRRICAEASGSKQALNIITQWLEDCLGHYECLQYRPSTPMPTRVLDVSNGAIRLRHCSDITGPYVALSHCWGSSQILRTTHSTLEDFQIAIDDELLPQTFRDAVNITRHIKVQFLWIDSLCIVQDDNDDWIHESARMATIYRDAYLVVSAISAKDGNAGCFTKRSGKERPTMCFEMPLVNGQVAPVYIRHAKGHQLIKQPGYEAKYPLMTRAWALQERFLASRIVHFERNELTWECRWGTRCECESADYEQTRSRAPYFILKDNEDNFGHREPHYSSFKRQWAQPLDQEELYELWHKLVNEYYKLDCTYPSDYLPAISGLVKIFQQRGCGECVAGSWMNNIIRDLMWQKHWALGLTFRCRRPVTWRAPSWSWACARVTNTGIFTIFHLGTTENIAKFVAIDYKLASADPTGALRSAALTICAPMIEARILKSQIADGIMTVQERKWDIHEEDGEYRVTTENGRLIKDVRWSDWQLRMGNDWTVLRSSFELDYPEGDFEDRDEAAVILSHLATRENADPSGPPAGPQILILQSSRGLGGQVAASGCYERVGMINGCFHMDGQIFFKWFEGAEDIQITIV